MVRNLGAALVVLALAAASAASAAAGETTLDWSVADRLTGPASVDEAAPVRELTLRVAVAGGVCPQEPRFALDGEAADVQPGAGCTFELDGVAVGRHRLTLSAGGGDEELAGVDLDLRDVLVVSIGDSVASGEGVPDGPGVRWLEKRCHRSLRSGAAQAARAVEQGDRRSVVTLVPLACSGATIEEGLLGPYDGIQPDRRLGALPPQVDVLDRLDRPIDAVLLSIGANDVNFGPLAQFCMFVRDCPSQHFDPDHPRREAAASFPTADEAVRAALRRLVGGYDRLAARLRAKVDPGRVVLVEYFDSLRDANGDTCRRALPGLDLAEAQWAQRTVLAPLNAELHAAAARHGWQLVGGVTDAFRRHGICAGGGAWVADPFDSAVAELGFVGTLHPNRAGHLATASLVAPRLAAALELGPEVVTTTPPSDGGGVPWPWLLVAAAGGAVLALLIRKAVS